MATHQDWEEKKIEDEVTAHELTVECSGSPEGQQATQQTAQRFQQLARAWLPPAVASSSPISTAV